MSKMSTMLAVLGVVAGLGVAALPLSTYAADETSTDPEPVKAAAGESEVTQDTKINLTIEDVLSIDTDASVVNLNETNSFTGTALKVKVISNNSKGYTLNIKGSGTPNATGLTSDKNSNDVIAAADVAFASAGALALAADGSSVWGYSIDGTNFAGVTAEGEDIVTKNEATVAEGEETEVTFKAVLKNGQPAGTYTGQVTFTAANQPNA